MQKKDVLFLCQFFYPEYNSSATLPWDTARYLSQSGLTVGAMCGYPREYSNENMVPEKEVKDGVSITRLHYFQLERKRKISRLINYFSFTFAVLLHIWEMKRYKSVIVYSNPPILPMAAVLGHLFFGTKIIFVSYDVYPEVAYASGSLAKNGLISKVMQFINKSLFQRASKVIALTDEMKQFLLRSRPELNENNIVVIPNWAHESQTEISKEAFQKFGYSSDDFIVSYFGNMGICQDMETLLQAIDLLKDQEHIHFLIAGHGMKMNQLVERTKNYRNVQVRQFLTGADFQQALSISSCSIVSLENGLKGMCAPSKYYSYLQSGIPVVAVVEEDSYLEKEIREKGIGYSVRIGDGAALKEAVEELVSCKEIRLKMASNAKNLYHEKYAMHIALNKYVNLVKALTGIKNEQ